MNSHHWQDARLKKALEHAPDNNNKPSEAVRAYILEAAEQALENNLNTTPHQQTNHWSHFMHVMASKFRMPWSAAWGTAFVIAGLGIFWAIHDPKTSFEPSSSTWTTDFSPTIDPQTIIIEHQEKPITPSTTYAQEVDIAPSTTVEERIEIVLTPDTLSQEIIQQEEPAPIAPPSDKLQTHADEMGNEPTAASGAINQLPPRSRPQAIPTPSAPAPLEMRRQELPNTPLENQTGTLPPSSASQNKQETSIINLSGNVARAESLYEKPSQDFEHVFTDTDTETQPHLTSSSGAGRLSSSTIEIAQNSGADHADQLLSNETVEDFGSSMYAALNGASTASDLYISSLALSLPEQLTFTLENWSAVTLAQNGNTYTLKRSTSAPLPEVLLRILSISHTQELRQASNDLEMTFYDDKHLPLGVLTLSGKIWQFTHEKQNDALMGALTESQLIQLQKILHDLTIKQ